MIRNFKYIVPLFILLFGFKAYAQRIPDKVLDTFLIKSGKIVVYENHKWAYLRDLSKDSIAANKKNIESKQIVVSNNANLKKETAANKNKILDKKSKTNDTGNSHSVRKGDSLLAIAREHKTSVKALCDLNGLTSTSRLKIGQKIKFR